MTRIRILLALLAWMAAGLAPSLHVIAQDTPATPTAPTAAAKPAEPQPPSDAPAEPDDPNAQSEVRRIGPPSSDVQLTIGEDVHVGPGTTRHDILVLFGDVVVEGDVAGDIVSILGKVSVMGRVTGDIINVGGGIWIENGALVRGDVVSIGKGVLREPDGIVQGEISNLGWNILPDPIRVRAQAFYDECIRLARPLAPSVDFVWALWLGLILVQGLLSLLFPGTTKAILRAMQERPGGTFLLSILGTPLIFIVCVALMITGIGGLFVPFLIAALLVALAIGRIALFRLIGSRILALFGQADAHPLYQFGVGVVLVTGALMIPFAGLLAWIILFMWTLGGVLMALFRRDHLPKTAAAAASTSSTQPQLQPSMSNNESNPANPEILSAGPATAVAMGGSTSTGSPALGWQGQDDSPTGSPADIAVTPRPGFGRRLAALAIDWVPILFAKAAVPDALVGHRDGTVLILLGILYYAAMLTWRGTSLGGVVLGLRVVRIDGSPLDRNVAIVRALAAVLSGLCAGIGWFWASWDERRQTWHDRLAGTVVVRDDHVRPLV